MRLFTTLKTLINFLLVSLVIAVITTPVSAQELQRQEVVFKSGEEVISGTLVLPDSAVNVPVIIFMGGMYDWGDYHPQREIFIQENLEAVFPKSGVAVFYYDPRGVGESTGRWGRTTLDDFANDAIAAINFLQQRKEIDPERIGIVGHGEDAWVAQIVASKAPQKVKLMVSLAGPTFDPNRLLINQYHNEYICNGQDSFEAHEKAVQKALSHQNWVSVFPLTKRWRHMKMKQGFEPAVFIKDISIPSLFLFGENDGQVYSDWAIQALHEIHPDSLPPNFTVFSIAGANHFFHVVNKCFDYEEASESVQKNFSFRFKEIFHNWVFENL